MDSFASTDPALAQVAQHVWAHRRRNAMVIGLSIVAGVLVSFVMPQRYEASATLSPAASAGDGLRLSGAIASLGGQLGIDLTGRATPIRMYARLVASHWFLASLARTPTSGDTTLYQLLTGRLPDTSSSDYPRLMDNVVRQLQEDVTAGLDERASVFTLKVELGTRPGALQALKNALGLLTEFDTHVLRSQAAESRRFVEERVDSARVNLNRAEDSLAAFLAHNRTYEQSPLLQLQFQRLQRATNLRQEVYTALARNLEDARIQEVREAPLLTIVDPPHVLWVRSRPKRRNIVGLFAAASLALVLATALLATTASVAKPR